MIADRIVRHIEKGKRITDPDVVERMAKNFSVRFQQRFLDEQEEKKSSLRLSSSGKCAARLAFQHHGYDEEAVASGKADYASELTFFIGDVVESALLALAQLSGVDVSYIGQEQAKVVFMLYTADGKPVEVPGHPDALVHQDGQDWILDVKSMSDYGFRQFTETSVEDDHWMREYWLQLQGYIAAWPWKIAGGIILGYNKQTGDIHEQTFAPEKKAVKEIAERYGRVITSKRDVNDIRKLREVQPDKRGRLVKCEYCPFWKTCWGKEVILKTESVMGKEADHLYVLK